MDVKKHYDEHLAHFYAWMAGDFDTALLAQKAFFENNVLTPPFQNAAAVDLGCGHGLQSMALAQLGYTVTAVDFSKQLLDELRARKNNLPIACIEGDLSNFSQLPAQVQLFVCMGDTLAHLPSFQEMELLFQNIHAHLAPKGKLVLSFRNYSTALEDTQRFIPVRADNQRIHTCLLEYMDTQVRVTDLLHEHTNSGWTQKVSSYLKLRLNPEQVCSSLKQQGFKIQLQETINRMIYVVAEKI